MDIDYAMLQKIYGADPNPEKRYSPATILSSTTEVIQGNPDPKHISTSYVERLNWSLRTSKPQVYALIERVQPEAAQP